MANETAQADQLGEELCLLGAQGTAILRDDVVTGPERRRLRVIFYRLRVCALQVERIRIGELIAQQALRLPAERVPNKHIKARLADVQRREAELAEQAPTRVKRVGTQR